MKGLYDLYTTISGFENSQFNNRSNILQNSIIGKRLSMTGLEESSASFVYELISNSVIVYYEICPPCYKNNKKRKMLIEEILGGFKRNKSCYYSICSICLNKFFPK